MTRKEQYRKYNASSLFRNEIREMYLALQDYKCQCCKESLEYKRPVLDHCHETGKIRSLLCRKCNYYVGMVELGRMHSNKQIDDYLKTYEER